MESLPLPIEGPLDFRRAVLAGLAAAWDRDARTLWWIDPDFEPWPLDDPALVSGLTAWLRRPGRRLVMLADSYAVFERRHARFANWRVDWSHAIDPRTPSESVGGALPTLLLHDGPLLLELVDRDRLRGHLLCDAAAARAAREGIDAALQRSTPAWPVKPLGL